MKNNFMTWFSNSFEFVLFTDCLPAYAYDEILDM